MSKYICPECGLAHSRGDCHSRALDYIAEGERFLRDTERATEIHVDHARRVVSTLVFALDAEHNRALAADHRLETEAALDEHWLVRFVLGCCDGLEVRWPRLRAEVDMDGPPNAPRGHYVLSSANGWLREAVYEIRNGVAGEAAEEPRMEVSRRDATRRCRGCGCEISITATYCGECMCEEDGV